MTSRKAHRKKGSDDWMSRIRESSHDVVLAGLASLTRAYGANVKRRPADFKTLVAEGRKLEPELHEVARRVWSEWVQNPGKNMALQPPGRLQGVFDERVRSALVRMGVPSGEEMAELRAKVDRLLAREGLTSAPRAKGAKREKVPGRAAPRRRPAQGRPVDARIARRRTAGD